MGDGGVILGTVSCGALDLGLRLAHGVSWRSGLWDEACCEVLELDRMETWGAGCRILQGPEVSGLRGFCFRF